MVNIEHKFLKFIYFKDIEKWHVNEYLSKRKMESIYPIISLSKIIKPRKEKIKNKEYNGQLPIIEKIRFADGKVFFREKRTPKTDLYLSKENDLIVSNINFEKGAFAINEWGDITTSTDYQPYVITKGINLEYLNLVLRSNYFLQNVKSRKPDGMKTRARYDFIKTFSIPVPPTIDEQKVIVRQYNSTIKEAVENQEKAIKLEESIEEYLFHILFIEKPVLKEESSSFLKKTSFKKLFKWDVALNLNKINPKDIFKSSKYKNVPITTFFEINPSTKYPKDIDEVSFLPMECISDTYGEIITQKAGKTGTKGYTKFMENDVIWARITPCMQNGKCAIVKDLRNGYGYGSTEYHVFRAIQGKAIPEYAYCFLRTNTIRRIAQSYFTGSAGQQRVGIDFLENLTLPLLPVKSNIESQLTQEKIVKHIFEIKKLVKIHRQRAEYLRKIAEKQLEEAIFGEAN